MSRTQVIQSHRQPLPATWYQPCIDSVRQWSELHGYEYRWLGDELFDLLPVELRRKTAAQPVVASDMARLAAMREALSAGYERVVWFDADTLVIAPEQLQLPEADHAFGREVWVQHSMRGVEKVTADVSPDRLRIYDKIHNAFMCFSAGNPFLEFYLYAAQRLVTGHQGPMVSQLVGPKFLATLNNLLQLPVLESAGVLCPLVLKDLLAGSADGAALQLFRRHSRVTPAALNLCGSMVADGSVDDADMAALVERLLSDQDASLQLLEPLANSEPALR